MVCALDTMHIVGCFLYFYHVLALEIDAYTASVESPQTPVYQYSQESDGASVAQVLLSFKTHSFSKKGAK